MAVPGEDVDGAAYYRPLHSERAHPGAIMVDGTGRRFVNEAQNYGDVGEGHGPRVERPCWLVFDDDCRRRHPVGPLEPGDPDPAWLRRADDLASLAGPLGVPAPGTLVATVERLQRGRAPGPGPRVRPGLAALRPLDR